MANENSQDDTVDRTAASKHGVVFRILKQRPLMVALTLVCVFGATELATGSYFEYPKIDLKKPVFLYQKLRIERVARGFSDQLVAEIGHGVRIESIEGRPGPSMGETAASYIPDDKRINLAVDEFAHSIFVSEWYLLGVLGHECAHAVFFQAELFPRDETGFKLTLAGEMAAEVLGAHLVGRVRTRDGIEGKRVTRLLLGRFRGKCIGGLREIDPTHYGPVEVISDMNRICLENPDLWKAAHIIAEEYFIVDETGEWKYRDGLNQEKAYPQGEGNNSGNYRH